MTSLSENNESSKTHDGDVYPQMLRSPVNKWLLEKVEKDEKKITPVPYVEEPGINYAYLDHYTNDTGIPHYENIKLDVDQLIYQFSDLNDVIVRKMISFKQKSLNFTDICKKPSINLLFVREFLDKIDFVELTKNDSISNDDFKIIDEFIDRFNWDDLCKNIRISPRFMEKYHDKIKWDSIIYNITFTEEHIVQCMDKINLSLLLNFEKRVLSNDFVRTHIEELNVDTEEKILRLFNNLPVNGNTFQTIGREDERYINGEIRGNQLSKSASPWNNTEQIIHK